MSTVVVTNKYPSSMLGGRSLDIVVGQGEQVVVYAYATDFSGLPDLLQMPVQRFIGSGNYKTIPDDKAQPAAITDKRWEITLSSPGTYAIMVPPTLKAITVDEVR